MLFVVACSGGDSPTPPPQPPVTPPITGPRTLAVQNSGSTVDSVIGYWVGAGPSATLRAAVVQQGTATVVTALSLIPTIADTSIATVQPLNGGAFRVDFLREGYTTLTVTYDGLSAAVPVHATVEPGVRLVGNLPARIVTKTRDSLPLRPSQSSGAPANAVGEAAPTVLLDGPTTVSLTPSSTGGYHVWDDLPVGRYAVRAMLRGASQLLPDSLTVVEMPFTIDVRWSHRPGRTRSGIPVSIGENIGVGGDSLWVVDSAGQRSPLPLAQVAAVQDVAPLGQGRFRVTGLRPTVAVSAWYGGRDTTITATWLGVEASTVNITRTWQLEGPIPEGFNDDDRAFLGRMVDSAIRRWKQVVVGYREPATASNPMQAFWRASGCYDGTKQPGTWCGEPGVYERTYCNTDVPWDPRVEFRLAVTASNLGPSSGGWADISCGGFRKDAFEAFEDSLLHGNGTSTEWRPYFHYVPPQGAGASIGFGLAYVKRRPADLYRLALHEIGHALGIVQRLGKSTYRWDADSSRYIWAPERTLAFLAQLDPESLHPSSGLFDWLQYGAHWGPAASSYDVMVQRGGVPEISGLSALLLEEAGFVVSWRTVTGPMPPGKVSDVAPDQPAASVVGWRTLALPEWNSSDASGALHACRVRQSPVLASHDPRELLLQMHTHGQLNGQGPHWK